MKEITWSPDDYIQRGKDLIKFGRALKNKKTSINKLSDLAFDCGFSLEFRFIPATLEKIEKDGDL